MSRDILIGREEEIARLERCIAEERPQLILVYGRKRLGKTYLIDRFFQGRFDFKLTGISNAPTYQQLHNFIVELNRQRNTDYKEPKNWIGAFELLRSYLSALPVNEKHIVFF